MNRCLSLTTMGLLAAATISTASAQVLVTDTFSRDTSVSGGWGAVDNGLVGGESGTVAASYTLDGSGVVDGAAGSFANSRIVLDYNLAADPDVIAGGGFVVEWQVNPGDGDDAAGETGLGREFAGIALSDSNLNPPFGGAGALTNASNETIRFAILPRNSGSVGSLTRTAGNVRTLTAGGNPSSGFNETVFDQATFDDYVNSGLPDPFANDTFYDVRLEVVGDFTAGSSTLITATVGGLTLPQFDIEWGVAGEAYLSGIAFNGPHQYDNLKISAIPEPASLVLAAVGGLALLRRRA